MLTFLGLIIPYFIIFGTLRLFIPPTRFCHVYIHELSILCLYQALYMWGLFLLPFLHVRVYGLFIPCLYHAIDIWGYLYPHILHGVA